MPPLRLRAVVGSRPGRSSQELTFPGPRVRIGRSRDNDLILPERDTPLASGHHAEALLQSDGTWWVVDLGSVNGTRLNGVLVDRHALSTGDRLAFGDEAFTVTIGTAPSGKRPLLVAIVVILLAVLIGVVARFRGSGFERVATIAPRSVYLITLERGGHRTIVGTAFAVSVPGGSAMLATNAHVANALRQEGAFANPPGDVRAVAVQSDTYDARGIAAATLDPDWHQGSMKSDVALLRLAPGPALAPLTLRTAENVERGVAVAAFGFPAVSTDPEHPRGRLTVDVVGDMRGDYLAVGLGIAPGTSGSPVFDEAGRVVGMVVGGDFVDAPGGVQPSGSSANWALSARVVADFIRRASAGRTS